MLGDGPCQSYVRALNCWSSLMRPQKHKKEPSPRLFRNHHTLTISNTNKSKNSSFLDIYKQSRLNILCTNHYVAASDHLPPYWLPTCLPVIHIDSRSGINFSAYLTKMPSSSHLRLQTTFEPISAETTRSHFFASPPQKKQKMSLTQTYYIAASARSKLGKEACRADHDLRLLVGHANLLDSLMVELADAEKKQEEWFNSTVRQASKTQESRHIQWVDSIEEGSEEDDSDSDSDFYDEDGDFDMVAAAPRRIISPPVQITTTEVDEDEEDFYEDDLEDDADLALTRVSSQSPPELVYEEDSEDESPPTSPPQPSMEFSEKEALLTSTFYAKQPASYMKGDYFIPESTAPLISSY
jgi:hypothetical protein